MENSMQQLRQQCLSCENCPLAKTRHNVVFGVGVENAEVVFIGEGPGENEDLQGEPFVGKGGALLDKYLTAIDLSGTKTFTSPTWSSAARRRTATPSRRKSPTASAT